MAALSTCLTSTCLHEQVAFAPVVKALNLFDVNVSVRLEQHSVMGTFESIVWAAFTLRHSMLEPEKCCRSYGCKGPVDLIQDRANIRFNRYLLRNSGRDHV